MNTNSIVTMGFSNSESEDLMASNFSADADARALHEAMQQCGGCTYYAPFNADWGLCCNSESRHQLETISEHFTCASHEYEDWGPHSFGTDAEFYCRCRGEAIGAQVSNGIQEVIERLKAENHILLMGDLDDVVQSIVSVIDQKFEPYGNGANHSKL